MAMKKKSAAKKSVARKRSARSAKALPSHIVLSPGLKPTGYAKKALFAFDQGIQREYRKLARLGVETVVMQDGVIVRGVPRQVKGRFVVSEPSPSGSRK